VLPPSKTSGFSSVCFKPSVCSVSKHKHHHCTEMCPECACLLLYALTSSSLGPFAICHSKRWRGGERERERRRGVSVTVTSLAGPLQRCEILAWAGRSCITCSHRASVDSTWQAVQKATPACTEPARLSLIELDTVNCLATTPIPCQFQLAGITHLQIPEVHTLECR